MLNFTEGFGENDSNDDLFLRSIQEYAIRKNIQEYAKVQSDFLMLLRQFASQKFLRNICPTENIVLVQFLTGFLRVTHLSSLFSMFSLSIRTYQNW